MKRDKEEKKDNTKVESTQAKADCRTHRVTWERIVDLASEDW